jgi:hypothetical protein
MIVYLTVLYSGTLGPYLRQRGRDLAPGFRVVPYHALGQARRLPRATYIFADVERLAPTQAALAEQVLGAIAAQRPPLRVLNHPTRSLTRFALLRALRAQGVNTFRVYRGDDDLSGVRFPVFVRGAGDHLGPRSDLIEDPEQLEAIIAHAMLHGHEPADVLVVEYEDTRSADGLFRKYGAVRVGDRIIPRHLWFARSWVQKEADKGLSAEMLDEERAYLASGDHQPELMDIFQTARIDYGRIDYAVVDGRITVWEINTNPSLFMADPSGQHPGRVPFDDGFDRRLREAWAEIDHPADEAGRLFDYELRVPRAAPGQPARGPA